MTSRRQINFTNKPNTVKADRLCQINAIGKIRYSLIHFLVIAHIIVRYMLFCFDLFKVQKHVLLSYDSVVCSFLHPKWLGKIETVCISLLMKVLAILWDANVINQLYFYLGHGYLLNAWVYLIFKGFKEKIKYRRWCVPAQDQLRVWQNTITLDLHCMVFSLV